MLSKIGEFKYITTKLMISKSRKVYVSLTNTNCKMKIQLSSWSKKTSQTSQHQFLNKQIELKQKLHVKKCKNRNINNNTNLK